ncbi:MAG: glycosyltransferase [Calditrichaceae bacterium]|nr:glycosyltransferase [Calditrichia bacterium]NUQ43141.1 glycosyltransferase [Calditrichaceae bacterium]
MKQYRFYSVIVPSFDRREEIRELLNSFTALDFPVERYELIIADDGSGDGTAELVQEFRGTCRFALHFYRQENRGPGPARNMGMERAKGDFFIFVDSDCTVSPGWLAAIDRELHNQQGDAFGGPDSHREDFPPLLKAINYSMTSFLTTGGIRGHKQKSLGKFYPRSFNMGLSRKVYEAVGGFGGLRHGQDIEFSHRIISSGARVILVPGAVVYHKRRTSIRKFFRQVFNWGVARINLYKIDPAMLEPVHALPALATLLLILLTIGSLLSPAVWGVFKWMLLAAVAILLLSGIHAASRYRSPRLLYLVPLVLPIQILGYGLGFCSGFVARVVFKKGEIRGFRKKYYQ